MGADPDVMRSMVAFHQDKDVWENEAVPVPCAAGDGPEGGPLLLSRERELLFLAL